MNLKAIILSAIGAVFIGGVATGFYLEYHEDKDKPDGSPIKKSAPVYESSEKIKYNLANYSVELSDDFLLESPDNFSENDKESLRTEFVFSSDIISMLEIKAHNTCYTEGGYLAEASYNDICDDTEAYSDVTYEIIPTDDFRIGAVHYKNLSEDRKGYECGSEYIITSQTNQFYLTANYSQENKDKALPILEDIAMSAVYTSDYRLPTTPQSAESDYFTVTDYDPMWNMGENTKASLDEDGCGRLYRATWCIAEADCLAEEYIQVTFKAEIPKNDRSPRVVADLTLNNIESKDNDKIVFDDVERSQEEILGFSAETLSFTSTFPGSGVAFGQKTYWFEKNGVVYSVEIRKNKGDDSMDDAVNELISRIKIK